MEAKGTVTVTNFGMATALGCDAATACAAARAGIRRQRRLDYFTARSPVDGKREAVAGHPVSIAEGFEGSVRLTRLLAAGLTDLQGKAAGQTGGAGFYLSVPNPYRHWTGAELLTNVEIRRTIASRAPKKPPDDGLEEQTRALLANAAGLANWPGDATLRFVSCAGHAGTAEALQRAWADLNAGAIQRVVVGGVDTLLEADTLQWLHQCGRLKVRGMPVGLQPGEACALVLLESAGRKEDSPLACVEALGMSEESDPLLSGRPSRSSGLVGALQAVAETAGWRTDCGAWLIADQNGETYRATEWGNVLCRFAGQYPAIKESVVWLPAASFGDTGAASGAIALCLAAMAFQRGYAPLPAAMVTMCSDGAKRGALVMRVRDEVK
jgi:hypothetical protein